MKIDYECLRSTININESIELNSSFNHRDPLSYPRLENEEIFIGRVGKQKIPFQAGESHISQRDEPWN
ncbi:hypothetical protein I4U23_010742 [Adineta vaga]|nr:hypothetical protein I4U23_010742 [Adineta vaga]